MAARGENYQRGKSSSLFLSGIVARESSPPPPPPPSPAARSANWAVAVRAFFKSPTPPSLLLPAQTFRSLSHP
jgi:hypothetical protein